MNRNPADVNLRYALRALRRRLPLFLACVLVVSVVAVVGSLLQKKQYTATATLYFRDPEFDQKLFGSSFLQNQPDPTRQAATNLGLVSLPRVSALTAAHLGVPESQVASAVTESSVGQSDLVSIQAVASTPAFAAELANTFGTQYIAFRRDADQGTIASAEVPLQRQVNALPARLRFGALGQSLQSRLSELRVLASLQTGDAELVQPAEVPTVPSSPKLARNGAIGLFFGLVLGVALVLLAEALDRRLRDSDEAEQIFDRPLLTKLPESEAVTTLDAAQEAVREPDLEAFRMLWANLRYFTISRDIRSVLVTSPDRDDGKSTVAWGLAAAAANAGERILIVEADLRNPTLAKRHNVSAPAGLTNVLAGDVALADAVVPHHIPFGDDYLGPTPSTDVLFAGPRPPNPSDLLQSHRMAELMRLAKEDYGLVVIDTPPVPVVSDAIPLITLVDGLIVVTRLGKTLRDHAHRLRRQLDQLDAPILGIVVNSAEPVADYGYGYGYHDYTPSAREAGTDGTPARGNGDASSVVASSGSPASRRSSRPGSGR